MRATYRAAGILLVCCVVLTFTIGPVRVGAAGRTLKSATSVQLSLPARRAARHTDIVTLRGLHMVTATNGWAVSLHSVLRTSNGGRTWKVVLTLPNARWPFDFSLRPLGVRHAWVVARAHESGVVVLSTTNAGASWHYGAGLADDPLIRNTTWAGSLSFPDRRHGWLLRLGAPVVGTVPDRLYRTSDGGLHWVRVGSVSVPVHRHGYPVCVSAITFNTIRSGWATGQCDRRIGLRFLYHSTDGGRSFHAVQLTKPAGFSVFAFGVYPLIFHGPRGVLPVYVYRPAAYVLYTSNNAGKTWLPGAPVLLSGSTLGPSVTTPDGIHIWVAANAAVTTSADRGRHWRIVARNPAFAGTPQIQFLNRERGFLLPGSPKPYMFVSKDGGRKWQRMLTRRSPAGQGIAAQSPSTF